MTSLVDDRRLGGIWFQIAHSGAEERFLAGMGMPVWRLIHESKNYYRLSFMSSPEDPKERHTGYATLDTNPNATTLINNVLSLQITSIEKPGTFAVIALRPLYLLYTDYLNYAFVGNEAVLYVLSRYPMIEKKEIPTIITIAVDRGYSGPQIKVRKAWASKLFAAPGSINRTVAPSFFLAPKTTTNTNEGKIRLSSLDEVCSIPCRQDDDPMVRLGDIEPIEGERCDTVPPKLKMTKETDGALLSPVPSLRKK